MNRRVPNGTHGGVRGRPLKGPPTRFRSDIEEEFDDVAVLDDVFLALQAYLARFARSRVVASRREIVVAHNLRADEAAFEIRVDLASRLWRLCAAADRPGAGFLFARRETAL